MPTGTRRQANTRSRNQTVGQSATGLASDEVTAEGADDDASPDQEMEDEEQAAEEEEDGEGMVSSPNMESIAS